VIAVLLRVLWVLIFLLVLRFVLRFVFGSGRVVTRGPGRPASVPERLGGELVRDPQCGTYVPKARAIAVGSGPDTKYFCSTTCRDKYAQ
jgi:uncharacterized protein